VVLAALLPRKPKTPTPDSLFPETPLPAAAAEAPKALMLSAVQ
jgi:hypothetical protein